MTVELHSSEITIFGVGENTKEILQSINLRKPKDLKLNFVFINTNDKTSEKFDCCLKEKIQKSDTVFVIVSYSFGTKPGTAYSIIKSARETKKICLAFIIFPFCFEPSKYGKNAELELNEIKKYSKCQVFKSDDLIKTAPRNLTLKNAFEIVNEKITDTILVKCLRRRI